MQCISTILNTTGISQEILAGYTGLSRQAMMYAGSGSTSLDTGTLIKLSRLAHCIDSAAGCEKIQPVPGDIYKHAAERETFCRYRALVLQRKLHACETAQKKYTHFLRALELLQAEGEEERLWIDKTKRNIIKKLDKCGVAACICLRKKVYLLEAEAGYIRRFVNEKISGL